MKKARKQLDESAVDFYREHRWCWMCRFLGHQHTSRPERHHIAGRGRNHDTRANYAALCHECHQAIQSQKAAELVCLVLKRKYDPEHYDPAGICYLRGWAASWMTDADVDRTERIMSMMRGVM